MAIELHCTGCGQRLRVGDEHAGKKAKCPQCQTIFDVPTQKAIELPGGAASPPERDSGAAGDAWFLQTPDGKSYGPVSKPVMDQWFREGRIIAECQIRQNGQGTWRPANEFYPSLGVPSVPTFTDVAIPGEPAGSSPGPNPYQSPTTAGRDALARAFPLKPHRGGTVLTMAILGWACCVVFGVIAWVMGKSDLKEMRAGRMDRSGEGLTQAGMIVGMVQCILSLVFVAIYLVVLAGMFLAGEM